MTSEQTDTRQRYTTVTKAQVVTQCARPEASVARIAMAQGINANVVNRGRKLARGGAAKTISETGEFIALVLTMAFDPTPSSAPAPAAKDSSVELRRVVITMPIT